MWLTDMNSNLIVMAQLLENRNVEACNGIWAVKLFGEKVEVRLETN